MTSDWEEVLEEVSHSASVGKLRGQFPTVFNVAGTIRAAYCLDGMFLVDASKYDENQKDIIRRRLIMKKYRERTLPSKQQQMGLSTHRDIRASRLAASSALLSKAQQALIRKLKSESFTLTDRQKQVLCLIVGPLSGRRDEKKLFGKDGHFYSDTNYAFLPYLQDSTGEFLVNESSLKDDFRCDKRPDHPIFRSIDSTNSTFKRMGAEDQDDASNPRPVSSNTVEAVVESQTEVIAKRRKIETTRPEQSLLQREVPDERRHSLPDFNYLDEKAVLKDLYKIEILVQNTYGSKLQSQNPHGYKPFREYPVLGQHDYLHGTGAQLPVVRILRNIFCTPRDMRLEERVKSLRAESMTFPDMMEILVTFWIFEKLSQVVFFPDDHSCLKSFGFAKCKGTKLLPQFSKLKTCRPPARQIVYPHAQACHCRRV